MGKAIFGIRAGRTPQKDVRISGVVYVRDEIGQGYAFVRLSEASIRALGRRMPQGLCEQYPSYLKVVYIAHKRIWRTFCLYKDERQKGIMLQESADRPVWLKNIHRIDNDETSEI